MANQLPPQFYKPIISRPKFHIFGENHGIIRGSTARRCQWCSSLLGIKEDVCPQCHATQIDRGYADNLSDAPAWRKRFKGLGGNPRGGFNGM